MALLGLLLGLQRLHHWQLILWHGDHSWRPESSEQAAALQSWCRDRELTLRLDRWGEAQAHSSEAAARAWRYQCLASQARRDGCSHVVTGHTASDRAETLLLHLARGSHRRGLASLPALRPLEDGSDSPLLSRPLLIFSRAETARIGQELGLPVWLDPSNDNPRFSRNRIRQEVLPVLEALHPGAARRLSGTAQRLQQEQDSHQEWVQVALAWMRTDERQLDRQRLMQLGPANQRSLLKLWLSSQAITLGDAQRLEELPRRLQQGQPPGQVDLAGGWQLRWNRFTLELIAPIGQAP